MNCDICKKEFNPKSLYKMKHSIASGGEVTEMITVSLCKLCMRRGCGELMPVYSTPEIEEYIGTEMGVYTNLFRPVRQEENKKRE